MALNMVYSRYDLFPIKVPIGTVNGSVVAVSRVLGAEKVGVAITDEPTAELTNMGPNVISMSNNVPGYATVQITGAFHLPVKESGTIVGPSTGAWVPLYLDTTTTTSAILTKTPIAGSRVVGYVVEDRLTAAAGSVALVTVEV